MGSSLNLTLTDELRAFIDKNCGDGTLYATPTEFMRAVLREKKQRLEAAGCQVETYAGDEISLIAEGGATCLTRPVLRR